MALKKITTPKGLIINSGNGKAELTWNQNFAAKRNAQFSRKQMFVDSEVLRRCSPRVPFQTGMLEKSGKLGTDVGSGEVDYIAPYAAMQYWRRSRVESYRELRDRQQKEFNELPLGFAFSMEQFRGMMERWGLDPEKDQDKIVRLPVGGFLQKKDRDHYKEVTDRHYAELEAAKKSDTDGTGFLYQMFLYELDNHE